ncbi:MAG TPA: XdhC family protein [Thermoanaerobaculia bacterium]|nr:XdhC family protein [Thermoanaerobaculia bacterium]
MRDVLEAVTAWRQAGREVALGTVTRVWGSAPRPLGSRMALSSAGEIAGSVSNGCVEGAVVEEAQGVLATGVPKSLAFGVSDETAWSVGLSCGGEIEVFVEKLGGELFEPLVAALTEDRLVVAVTVLSGGQVGRRLLAFPDGRRATDLASGPLADALEGLAVEALSGLVSKRVAVTTADGSCDALVEVLLPPPQLVLVGAAHVAIPLISLARVLGFRTVVVDPRRAFATPERFPHADRLLVEWPAEAFAGLNLHQATAVALLSHDLKLDVAALVALAGQPVRYLGALGSKKTHAKRVAAAREAGVAAEELARLHAPIGLDLGGRQPEEIALAALAEIVAVFHGREATT